MQKSGIPTVIHMCDAAFIYVHLAGLPSSTQAAMLI